MRRNPNWCALLVGRPLEELFPPRATAIGVEVLRLEHAARPLKVPRAGWQAPVNVSLTVHAGEIVGLAGLMGAGRSELLASLYGAAQAGSWSGTVSVGGRAVRLDTIASARAEGIAFVTDDRRGSGLVLRHSVRRNISLSVLRRISPFGIMSPARETDAVAGAISRFDIRPANQAPLVGTLSGGNQQKVVFAKELLRGPRPPPAR